MQPLQAANSEQQWKPHSAGFAVRLATRFRCHFSCWIVWCVHAAGIMKLQSVCFVFFFNTRRCRHARACKYNIVKAVETTSSELLFLGYAPDGVTGISMRKLLVLGRRCYVPMLHTTQFYRIRQVHYPNIVFKKNNCRVLSMSNFCALLHVLMSKCSSKKSRTATLCSCYVWSDIILCCVVYLTGKSEWDVSVFFSFFLLVLPFIHCIIPTPAWARDGLAVYVNK